MALDYTYAQVFVCKYAQVCVSVYESTLFKLKCVRVCVYVFDGCVHLSVCSIHCVLHSCYIYVRGPCNSISFPRFRLIVMCVA